MMGNRKKHNGPSCPSEIRLEHVFKSFGDEEVLKDLSLAFPAGSRTLLSSPSGTGKTTLFRLLLGLEKPDSGTVAFFKEDGAPAAPRFSAVFQEDRLLEGYSAVENLRLAVGNVYSPSELSAAASRLLPEESLKKPVSEFSGGMKRRTALLRALLAPSDILIMDEPFTGLDAGTKQTAAAMVLEFLGGRTLVFSSHSEEDAALLKAGVITLPNM